VQKSIIEGGDTLAKENCYLCGKEIEAHYDRFSDSSTLEIDGKELTEQIESYYTGGDGSKASLCPHCNKRVKEGIEKARPGKK